MAGAAHLHEDQPVRITVEGDRVIIQPVKDQPLTQEERLALYDPARHGGEVIVCPTLGAEQW